MIVVLKVGGSSAAAAAAQVAREAAGGRAIVVVHGGGPQISARMRERDLEPRYAGGRRITDAASLACVDEGLRAVNAELCADLEAVGLRTRGLPVGVVVANRVPELGLVGEPVGADLEQVRDAPRAGRGSRGRAARDRARRASSFLNVNADDAAAALAGALGADELRVPHGRARRARRARCADPDAAGVGAARERERRHAAEARGGCASALSAGVLRVWIGREGTLVRA